MDALLPLLRRGALAGLAGGAGSGLFGFLLAEPVMDRAVRLEEARQTASGVAGHAEVFSRSTQHAGLLVASTATGVALGVLFGALYAVLHRRDPADDPWRRSITLGAAALYAVVLVPFLRYPANPPGVGDPDTIGVRTQDWLLAIGMGLIGAAAAAVLARDLRVRGTATSVRQLAVGSLLLLTVGLVFVLPANPDALDVPAGLLWQFRLLSLATTTLLWTVLAVGFGLLGERQTRPSRPQTARMPAPVSLGAG